MKKVISWFVKVHVRKHVYKIVLMRGIAATRAFHVFNEIILGKKYTGASRHGDSV